MYQDEFEDLFRKAYSGEDCDLSTYFDEVQLPYISYYAYGEKIAVLEERSEALSLRRAYEVFFERLLDLDYAWEAKSVRSPQSQPVSVDVAEPVVPASSPVSLEVGEVIKASQIAVQGPLAAHFRVIIRAAG